MLAMTTKPLVTDVNVERESLQDFLSDMSQCARRSGSSLGTGNPSLFTAETKKPSPRAVTHMNLVSNVTPSTENSTSPKRDSEDKAQVFRKEKLSTKVIILRVVSIFPNTISHLNYHSYAIMS